MMNLYGEPLAFHNCHKFMKLHTHQGEAEAYTVAITKVNHKLLSFCVWLLHEIANAQAGIVGGVEIHPRHHTGLFVQSGYD